MKDDIKLTINIDRLEKNLGKINDEIRSFVLRLRKLCEVKDFNLIKLKMK